jgi:hypothetical protein
MNIHFTQQTFYLIIAPSLLTRTGRPLVSYGLATYESGELAKMEVRLSPRPSAPNPEEFPYHVVDTDYSSYAVIASCEELCRGQRHAGDFPLHPQRK